MHRPYAPVDRPVGCAAVEVSGARKSLPAPLDAVTVLDGADLRVARGEVVAILAPPGLRRAVAVSCLSGLEPLDAGSMRVDGMALDDGRARRTGRNHRIGFVFERDNLVPTFSVAENVEVPLLLSHLDTRHVRARALDALGEVGLAERAEGAPGALSADQGQRAALARAIVHDPVVVWMVEPTALLGDADADRFLTLVRTISLAHRIAVVLVTADPEVAARADRTLRLADGRLEPLASRAGGGTFGPVAPEPPGPPSLTAPS